MTGYQGKFKEDPNFWYNYKDFFELGEDGNFIKTSNLNPKALDKEEREKFNNRVSRQIPALVSFGESRS